jgi:hypothetical protein
MHSGTSRCDLSKIEGSLLTHGFQAITAVTPSRIRTRGAQQPSGLFHLQYGTGNPETPR